MPEGPEVRRFADALNQALGGKPIVSLLARTKTAKVWEKEHLGVLLNKRIERVLSHGKHLVGLIEGGYYFHSHLMMWGSWAVLDNPPQEIDRRERSRIVVPDACAILYSAPIFNLGAGNPFEIVENLRTLGSDILPYPDEKPFDAPVFLQKLVTPENSDRTIGAALLDQQIVAGIGNYLRAEILFNCRLDPWRKIADLTASELERLIHSIPLMAQRAYTTGGFTVSDEARMRLFHPIKFMLATPADDLTEVAKQMPAGFAVEDKYDGIRAQVHIAPYSDEDSSILHGTVSNGKRVAIFSRTLDEITASFPDLIEPLAAINLTSKDSDEASDLILDGEIVPIQGEPILPFQELQKRLGRKKVSDELLTAVPVAFIAYDVLYAFGHVLINEPFAKRRSLLESLHLDTQRVRCGLSQQVSDISTLDAEFTAARARGNEGLMVKDLNSTYKPGRRGRDWLKIKRAMATLDVVVTAAEVGNGKRHRFLSDYTFAVRQSETEPTLLNIGKAYSGLTDAQVAELSDWFRAHTLQELAHGKVCIVEPRIVLEVTFDRVQASSRHNSGYALRFPRIVRVRNDKPPEEIDTLETVRRLAETLASEPATEDSEGFVDSAAPLENASTSLSQVSNRVYDCVELENNINQTPTLEAARDTFKAFVEGIQPDKSVVVLHDSDADGVTAGVVLQLALSRAGFENVKIVAPARDSE